MVFVYGFNWDGFVHHPYGFNWDGFVRHPYGFNWGGFVYRHHGFNWDGFVHGFIYLFDGDDHVSLQLQQPLLDLTTCFRRGDDVTQLHDLALRALQVRDVQDVRELQLSDALETLLQVRLHSEGNTI